MSLVSGSRKAVEPGWRLKAIIPVVDLLAIKQVLVRRLSRLLRCAIREQAKRVTFGGNARFCSNEAF